MNLTHFQLAPDRISLTGVIEDVSIVPIGRICRIEITARPVCSASIEPIEPPFLSRLLAALKPGKPRDWAAYFGMVKE